MTGRYFSKILDNYFNKINIATRTSTSIHKASETKTNTTIHINDNHFIFREFTSDYQNIPDIKNYHNRFNALLETVRSPSGPWGKKLMYGQLKALTILEQNYFNYCKKFNFNLILQNRLYTKLTAQQKLARVEKYQKKIIAYLNKKVIPELTKILATTKSQLRHAEIKYLNRKGRPDLLHVYQINPSLARKVDAKYISLQKVTGHYTDQQLEYLGKSTAERNYYKICYDRYETGVANMHWQCSGVLNRDQQVTLNSSYLRHANLFRTHYNSIAIEQYYECVLDAEQIVQTVADKIFKNIYNVNQNDPHSIAQLFQQETPLAIPLHELRLLSILDKNLDALDMEHRGRWQMENTFFAFNLCQQRSFPVTVQDEQQKPYTIWVKPQINLSDFGVNATRFKIFSDPLQDWMNTRAMNQLWDNLSELFAASKTGVPIFHLNTPEYGQLKAKAAQSQANLNKLYQDFHQYLNTHYKDNSSKVNVEIIRKRENLLILEKQHYYLEQELLDIRMQNQRQQMQRYENNIAQFCYLPKQKLILELWLNLQYLYEHDRFTKSENTYLIQAFWCLLAQELNHEFATGCNDNKDRGSRMAEKVEALKIFHHQNGYYPRLYQPNRQQQDRAYLMAIEKTVNECSTAIFGTELSSIPGCFGEQVDPEDGNKHLNLNHRLQASLAKGPYKTSKSYAWASIKGGFYWGLDKAKNLLRNLFQPSPIRSSNRIQTVVRFLFAAFSAIFFVTTPTNSIAKDFNDALHSQPSRTSITDSNFSSRQKDSTYMQNTSGRKPKNKKDEDTIPTQNNNGNSGNRNNKPKTESLNGDEESEQDIKKDFNAEDDDNLNNVGSTANSADDTTNPKNFHKPGENHQSPANASPDSSSPPKSYTSKYLQKPDLDKLQQHNLPMSFFRDPEEEHQQLPLIQSPVETRKSSLRRSSTIT